MAAAAILEKFQMAISPQRLTIYLYSTHPAVIFAIAQLSLSQNKKAQLSLTNPRDAKVGAKVAPIRRAYVVADNTDICSCV